MESGKASHFSWEKIFVTHISDKGLIYRIYKLFLHLNQQQKNNPIKKWAKELNREFSRKIYKWPLNTKKMLNITNHENANQNYRRYCFTPISSYPKKKKGQKIITVGEGCRESGTPVHCWWGCKMGWWSLKKWDMKLTTCCSTSILGYIYPGTQTGTCTPVFTATLFTKACIWKHLRCSSTDEWITEYGVYIYSGIFSRSFMSNSSWPHELQHARLPCPSPTPEAYSNSCRPLLPPSVFPSIRVFSNEYSGLISFRMDWLDLLAVQGTLKSLLQHHSSKASILKWYIVQP